MWMTACRKCGWTSGTQIAKDAADALGQLHEQNQPGHSVVMKELRHGPQPQTGPPGRSG